MEGGWEWLNEVGYDHPVAQTRFNDALIEGDFTGTWLELNAHFQEQSFEIQIDKASPSVFRSPNAKDFNYVRLAENLPYGSHHFRLRLVDRHNAPLLARSLRTDGYLQESQPAHKTRLLGFGASTFDFCGVIWQTAQAKGWEAINRGIGGTTLVNSGLQRIESDVLPFQPDVMLINYGSNDWYSNIPVETFQSAFEATLNKLAEKLPETHFVVVGIFPRRGGSETTRPLYNKAMQEAISHSTAASHTRYLEIKDYSWQTNSMDGTHPNQQAVRTIFVPQILPYLE